MQHTPTERASALRQIAQFFCRCLIIVQTTFSILLIIRFLIGGSQGVSYSLLHSLRMQDVADASVLMGQVLSLVAFSFLLTVLLFFLSRPPSVHRHANGDKGSAAPQTPIVTV